jgi:hypothetical protein
VDGKVDWDAFEALVEESYRSVATKGMLRLLAAGAVLLASEVFWSYTRAACGLRFADRSTIRDRLRHAAARQPRRRRQPQAAGRLAAVFVRQPQRISELRARRARLPVDSRAAWCSRAEACRAS